MAKELAQLFVTLGLDDKNFQKGMNKFQRSMQNVSKDMAIAGGVIVGAIAAIGGASIKMAADFDKAMREVNTMMLLGEDQFRDFSNEVREMASTLGVDAVESAKALYQAISAGVPKENAIDFMTVATKAAIGGVSDLTTAVDGLTTVINAFGLNFKDAERVADIMFTTVKGGKTTLTELADSLFNVAPVASAMGVSIEEVAAALATMTQQGVPTAQATTQLRQAILALSAPTVRQKTALEELGLEMNASHLESVGLAGAFNEILEATKGDEAMMRRLLGSIEAVQAVLQLTGDNADKFAIQLNNMGNSAGAAEAAFQQMESSVSRQFEKLTNSVKEVAMSIGDALIPVFIDIVNKIKPIIQAIGDWIKEHPELVRGITLVAGAIGSLLLTFGLLGMMLPSITRGLTYMINTFKWLANMIKSVVAAQWLWNTTLLNIPVGAVIAGLAAIGAAIYGIVRALNDTRSASEIVFDAMSSSIYQDFTGKVQRAFNAWSRSAQDTLEVTLGVIDKLRQAENKAFNDRMGEIEDERLAKIAAVDEEAAAAIAALQDERDAIYAGIEERRRAKIREQEEARILELQNLIAAEEDAEKRKELEDDLAAYLIQVADRRNEEMLQDRIDAIGDEILAVQDAAEDKKNTINDEAEAEKDTAQDIYDAKIQNLTDMETAENKRFQQQLRYYEDELQAFIDMNDLKLANLEDFVKKYNELITKLGGGEPVEIPAVFQTESGAIISQMPEGGWINEQGQLVPPPSFQGWEGPVPGPIGAPVLAVVHGGEVISQPESKQGNTLNFNIYGLTVRAEEDIDKIARKLFQKMEFQI